MHPTEDQLLDHVRPSLGAGPWGVATVTADGVQVAAEGAEVTAPFEIGSLSKGVTGLLFADAIERGEIARDTRLGDLLDLEDRPAGNVTLGALSTHSSGLPRLPDHAGTWARTWAWLVRHENPYGDTLAELLEQTRGTRLRRAKHAYSNLGFQLLGHAVAAAAGTTYRSLVEQRIATPLGLTSLSVPASPDELPDDAVHGTTRRGRPTAPWTGEGLGPAGGIRLSIADTATLAAALVDGSAPGVVALDPVEDFMGPGVRIGAAWLTTSRGRHGAATTWHNGATGGFASWLGVDRERGTGAVVLRARSGSVDKHGLALLRAL